MLPVPTYIDAAGLRGAPVKHKWTSTAPIDKDNLKLWEAFGQTSMRGWILLAAGSAEWVAWRFEGLANITESLQFIEAVYAGIADPAYTVPWEWPKGPEPTGPVDAPVTEGNRLLNEAFGLYAIRSTGAAQKSARLVQLAQHVLPSKKPFEEWFKSALRRLGQHYPYDRSDKWGRPMPRQALDPAFSYDPDRATDLLRDFLQRLDPASNPYLRPAQELSKAGFTGTPYTL